MESGLAIRVDGGVSWRVPSLLSALAVTVGTA